MNESDPMTYKNTGLKRAKDMGSAAVLLSLLNCFICWMAVIVLNLGSYFPVGS